MSLTPRISSTFTLKFWPELIGNQRNRLPPTEFRTHRKATFSGQEKQFALVLVWESPVKNGHSSLQYVLNSSIKRSWIPYQRSKWRTAACMTGVKSAIREQLSLITATCITWCYWLIQIKPFGMNYRGCYVDSWSFVDRDFANGAWTTEENQPLCLTSTHSPPFETSGP
jgi:hypothetical protein